MSTTSPLTVPTPSGENLPRPELAFEFDGRALRGVLGHFATGIAVVLARDQEALVGITINSFTSVSLEPPLVLFCLAQGARFEESIKLTGQVGISFLTAEQEVYSRYFAKQPGGEALGTPQTWGPEGLLLDGCAAGMLCTLEQRIEAGDHLIMLCRVKGIWQNPENAAALLYYRGRYATGHA